MDQKKILKAHNILKLPSVEILIVLLMLSSLAIPIINVDVNYTKITSGEGQILGVTYRGTMLMNAFYAESSIKSGNATTPTITKVEPLSSFLLFSSIVVLLGSLIAIVEMIYIKVKKKGLRALTNITQILKYPTYLFTYLIAYLSYSNASAFELNKPIAVSAIVEASVTYSPMYYLFLATCGLLFIRSILRNIVNALRSR